MEKKPGSQSLLNKVGTALGISVSILIFTFAITTVVSAALNNLPPYVFNYILVFAFSLLTINYAVLAHLSRYTYLRIAAIIAGSFMTISLLIVTQNHVYFVAAAGVVLAQIIPSLIEIKGEQRNG
ncbi:hypothetical protein N9M10_05430 [Hellea sp.]|nr:hypothetical protein [Hellea sp.]